MSNLEEIDFFTDPACVTDPYPYFESLRQQCPVVREPHQGVVAVTGYEEAVAVYRDSDTYSSCNAAVGPFGVPFEPQGDDVSDLIEQHRSQFPVSEHLVTFDPPEHTRHRELLKKLLTPKRLKENEEFMWRLADDQLDRFVADGRCEFITGYSQPFALLVIADLLGVPEEDHDLFRMLLSTEAQTPGLIDVEHNPQTDPLQFLDAKFTKYIEDRRANPREDVLTEMATATFPDGTTPEVADVVRVATFLFAAGQETTARLLGAALRIIAEQPELQQRLRDERQRLPSFVEETLRMESPVKSDFRLARKSTTLGGVEVPAGTTVMVLPGAVNRDPRRFECPAEFQVDRSNVREHIAFGRGIHTCAGAPLARAESRVSLERILDRMGDITLSDAQHGSEGERTFEYEPTFVLRGLNALHLEFTPLD